MHGFDVLMLAGLVRQTAEWRTGGAAEPAGPGEVPRLATTDTLARSADATGAVRAKRQTPEPDSLGG